MKIEQTPIDDITPYHRNPRKNDQAVEKVAESINLFGFNQPIVVDSNGVIVVGHTRLKAAQHLGMTQVPVFRLPADMPQSRIQAYRIADNKLNELADWDDTFLIEELTDIQQELGSITSTGFDANYLTDLADTTYSSRVETPIYEPRGEQPEITELYDQSKTDQLIADIDQAEIPEEEKQFLRAAAHRHTQFNYKTIAEYYCHCSPATQRLIEDSALVIIDYDRAIELGYVKLRDDLADSFIRDHGDEFDG